MSSAPALLDLSSSSTSTDEDDPSSCESPPHVRRRLNAELIRKRVEMVQRQHAYYRTHYIYPAPYPNYFYNPFPKYHKNKNQSQLVSKRHLCVALDCEMVGVGDHGAYSCLARVTLMDWNGNAIMDELVQPQWEVTDYRTFFSGITPELLDSRPKLTFAAARTRVLNHLRGKILVGHALHNDLMVLGIQHPWHQIRDTAYYQPFMRVGSDGGLWPKSLKELAKAKLYRDIQVCGRPHCPREDAMAALDLYRMVRRHWEADVRRELGREIFQPLVPTHPVPH